MSPEDFDLKAVRALASAKLLLSNGDAEGACNRAYYAMFDAAHASLLRFGEKVNPSETKTHKGLIGAFGKYLVQTKMVSPDIGRSINQVENIRLLADYTGNEIPLDKATLAVEQADIFLATLTELTRIKTLKESFLAATSEAQKAHPNDARRQNAARNEIAKSMGLTNDEILELSSTKSPSSGIAE